MPDAMPGSSLKLREKLAIDGAQCLSDAELLAVFISFNQEKKSCLPLAYDLLLQVGDLRSILNAPLPAFLQVSTLGALHFTQLQAAREICLRADYISLKKNIHLEGCDAAIPYIKRKLRDRKNETVAVLFLDSKQGLISYEEMFHGSIHASPIYLRPLVARALALNATAIIMAHNHPAGTCSPSKQDRLMTKRLERALELVEIHLLDHLIVADNEVFSMVKGCLLSKKALTRGAV